MDRVVNIIADGKLAYTGFISLAAERLNMREHDLIEAIDMGKQLPQPNIYKDGPDRRPVLQPKAKSYIGYWRDSAVVVTNAKEEAR